MTRGHSRGPLWGLALLVAGFAWWSTMTPSLAAGLSLVPEEEPIRIEVSRRGFEPEELRLRRGARARVVLTTADEEHCFAIDELRVEKRVVPGKPTSFELTPDRTGSFAFYCCLEPDPKTTNQRGRLVVAE